MVEFILYVKNQEQSKNFYKALLEKDPVLDVPGMTEFLLEENCKLGLMPEEGIAKILRNKIIHPGEGSGIPRCELYLTFKNSSEVFERAINAGAKEISPMEKRNWGDTVGYLADIDGHIIAIVEKKNYTVNSEKNITLRRAIPEDLAELRQLYIDTVTTVNAKDYSEEQIKAWIKPWYDNSPTRDGRTFEQKITEQYFIVAVIDNVIAGFGSIEDNGYLDFMYVHKDFQRYGAAKTLLNELERYAKEKNLKEINAIVSHTAKGFFEKHGWKKIREETVEVRGAVFTDNIMIKKI